MTSHIFLVLTLAILLIVIITSRDLVKTILIIGLITNCLIIGTELSLFEESHHSKNKKNEDRQRLSIFEPDLGLSDDAATTYSHAPGPATQRAAIADGDELLVYQARSRHDPWRLAAGIERRTPAINKYIRDELDEEENTVWWGRREL